MKDTLPPESAAGASTSASAAPISAAPSMSARDLFAALALHALVSAEAAPGTSLDDVAPSFAKSAFAFADAMIAARGPVGLDFTPREQPGPFLADPFKVTR